MSKKYPGGLITKTPVAPAGPFQDDAASGVWTLSQAAYWQEQGLWPIAGNSSGPTIGDAYEGGFYAGQISTAGNSVADYNLVIGPAASAYSASKQWKTSQTATAGTTSLIDGPGNSAAMNDASHPAAQFCEALTIGGFSDWYMPAKNELEVCFFNLKPTAGTAPASSGINANAVPARASGYSAGAPDQTSATAFKTGGAESFTGGGNGYYWSSTAVINQASRAWIQHAPYLTQNSYGYKSNYQKIRATRRVAV
jgi:hypothetical protein